MIKCNAAISGANGRFFIGDSLTCDIKKSACVNDKINDG